MSAAAAVTCALVLALQTYEVDLGVYLRLGARYALSPLLYSAEMGRTGLFFTYPPFAALLFAPMRLVAGVDVLQSLWTLGNLAALWGMLVLSLRAALPHLDRRATWASAAGLTLPALLLNPVFLTVGFGQVNLMVALLVMWDFLGTRRVGRFQIPMGLATGVAAAVKLTPAVFLVYLLLSRRVRAAVAGTAAFAVCGLLALVASPSSSRAFWTSDVFHPGRTGALPASSGTHLISNQNLTSLLERLHHGFLPGPVAIGAVGVVGMLGLWAAVRAGRSSPLLGIVLCAMTGLLVSPVSWAHHFVWIVPAIVWLAAAPDRPRHGRVAAGAPAVVFWAAPIWWVPRHHLAELHLGAWQLVAGNAFSIVALGFVAGGAALVLRRWSAAGSGRLTPG